MKNVPVLHGARRAKDEELAPLLANGFSGI